MTRYGLDGPGSDPGGGEIFRSRPDRPWGTPSLLYNGYRVIPGDKVAGAWRWPPTSSSARVKERVELYLYSSSGPSWPVIGRPLPLFWESHGAHKYGLLPQWKVLLILKPVVCIVTSLICKVKVTVTVHYVKWLVTRYVRSDTSCHDITSSTERYANIPLHYVLYWVVSYNLIATIAIFDTQML